MKKRKNFRFQKLKLITENPEILEQLINVFQVTGEERKKEEDEYEKIYECYNFGIAGSINNIIFDRACPHADRNTIRDAKEAIRDGNRLIISRGKIVCLDQLIASTNSSFFGMSGGPLCIVLDNQ